MFPGLGSSKGMEREGDAICRDFPRQLAFPSNSPQVHMARTRPNPEHGRPWVRPPTELGVCPSPIRDAPSPRLHVCSPRAALKKRMEFTPLESTAAFFTALCRKQPGATEPSAARGPAEARGMLAWLLCPHPSTSSLLSQLGGLPCGLSAHLSPSSCTFTSDSLS